VTGSEPRGHVRRPLNVRVGLAALLLVPLIELTVAILVGRRIGATATLTLLIIASACGLAVLRHAGARAVHALATASASGTTRHGETSHGDTSLDQTALGEAGDATWALAGGLLLLVPGFVTGGAGALLVLPPTRRVLRPLLGRGAGRLAVRLLGAPLRGRVPGTRVVQGNLAGDTVVDIEVLPPRTTQNPPEPPALPAHPTPDPRTQRGR
jgi:UPF0716 protein FxsA